ncbi:Suppressor of Sensor Kinase (SLN1), partial [Cladochytrium tenue]
MDRILLLGPRLPTSSSAAQPQPRSSTSSSVDAATGPAAAATTAASPPALTTPLSQGGTPTEPPSDPAQRSGSNRRSRRRRTASNPNLPPGRASLDAAPPPPPTPPAHIPQPPSQPPSPGDGALGRGPHASSADRTQRILAPPANSPAWSHSRMHTHDLGSEPQLPAARAREDSRTYYPQIIATPDEHQRPNKAPSNSGSLSPPFDRDDTPQPPTGTMPTYTTPTGLYQQITPSGTSPSQSYFALRSSSNHGSGQRLISNEPRGYFDLDRRAPAPSPAHSIHSEDSISSMTFPSLDEALIMPSNRRGGAASNRPRGGPRRQRSNRQKDGPQHTQSSSDPHSFDLHPHARHDGHSTPTSQDAARSHPNGSKRDKQAGEPRRFFSKRDQPVAASSTSHVLSAPGGGGVFASRTASQSSTASSPAAFGSASAFPSPPVAIPASPPTSAPQKPRDVPVTLYDFDRAVPPSLATAGGPDVLPQRTTARFLHTAAESQQQGEGRPGVTLVPPMAAPRRLSKRASTALSAVSTTLSRLSQGSRGTASGAPASPFFTPRHAAATVRPLSPTSHVSSVRSHRSSRSRLSRLVIPSLASLVSLFQEQLLPEVEASPSSSSSLSGLAFHVPGTASSSAASADAALPVLPVVASATGAASTPTRPYVSTGSLSIASTPSIDSSSLAPLLLMPALMSDPRHRRALASRRSELLRTQVVALNVLLHEMYSEFSADSGEAATEAPGSSTTPKSSLDTTSSPEGAPPVLPASILEEWPDASAPDAPGAVSDAESEEEQEVEVDFLSALFPSWEVGRLIGVGSSGMVFEAVQPETGERLFAIKQTRVVSSHPWLPVPKLLATILKCLRIADHPNVMAYYGVERVGQDMFIFTEFADQGSVRDVIYGRLPVPPLPPEVTAATATSETEEVAASVEGTAPAMFVPGIQDALTVRTWIKMTLEGLRYLHENGVIHRDLKPGNLLLKGGIIKIGDLGASTIAQTCCNKSHMTQLVGSPSYMAPEVIVSSPTAPGGGGGSVGRTSGRPAGRAGAPTTAPVPHGAQDIWSLGCCLFELVLGKPPWFQLDNIFALYYFMGTWASRAERMSPADLDDVCPWHAAKSSEKRDASPDATPRLAFA